MHFTWLCYCAFNEERGRHSGNQDVRLAMSCYLNYGFPKWIEVCMSWKSYQVNQYTESSWLAGIPLVSLKLLPRSVRALTRIEMPGVLDGLPAVSNTAVLFTSSGPLNVPE